MNPFGNFIPGINVGNAAKQIGSYVGLAPKGDYDVFDYWTNSNRPGQVNATWLPDITSSNPASKVTKNEQGNGNGTGGGGGADQSYLNGSKAYTGGSTYASAPNYAQVNANAIAQLQQSANTVQNSLNRLDGQLGIALGNIDTQKMVKDREAQGQFDSTQNQYNTSTTQNQQQYRGNKNNINDQASGDLRGFLRLLGSYGATGSDMGLAGQAVADQASRQNAGAGQTYAQNQSGLDTNWGNYKNAWEDERLKRNDWREQQRNSAISQSQTSRQDLLAKLGDINGQIGAARGGSYASSAQPYLDQANALSGQIDALGRLNPTYQGNTPQYTQKTLDSYQTQQNQTQIDPNAVAGGLNTPWLNALLGKDKDKQMV